VNRLLPWCVAVVLSGAACGGSGTNSQQPLPDTKDVVSDSGNDVNGTETPRSDDGQKDVVWPEFEDYGWLDLPDFGSPDLPDVKAELPPWLQDQQAEDVPEIPGVKVKDIQKSEDSLTCKVQFGSMLVALDLNVKSVVVTAPSYTYSVVGEKLDGFYVADVEGGAYSGIHVTFPTGQVPDLKPGLVYHIVGDHKEAFCFTVLAAKSMVLASDTGPAPKPNLTTVVELTGEPEAYEGVLVRLENVKVTSANPDKIDGMDNHEIEVDGALRIGNDYGVKYLSPGTDARKEGDEFQYIIGVVKYADGTFHVMPRFDSDMLLVGETPPVEEGPEPVAEVVESVDVIEEVLDVPDVVQDVPADVPPVDVPPVDVPADTGPVDVAPVDVPADVPPDLPPADTGTLDLPAQPPSPVVITEIMYDPVDVPDDMGEWFELFNASEDTVDINGWRIESDDGDMHILSFGGPILIPPGTFFVLGNNKQESTNGGVEVGYQYPKVDFSLMNTKDSIILKDIYGAVVDAVHFDEMLGWPAGKGASIMLIHPYLDNDSLANWIAGVTPYGDGTNMGTPGAGTW